MKIIFDSQVIVEILGKHLDIDKQNLFLTTYIFLVHFLHEYIWKKYTLEYKSEMI